MFNILSSFHISHNYGPVSSTVTVTESVKWHTTGHKQYGKKKVIIYFLDTPLRLHFQLLM